MAGAMVSTDGVWRVEPMRLDRGAGPETLLQVTRHGLYLGRVRTVEEVAALGVPIEDLVEEDG